MMSPSAQPTDEQIALAAVLFVSRLTPKAMRRFEDALEEDDRRRLKELVDLVDERSDV